MKTVVCIKQVPDTSEVKINPETNTLIRAGIPAIINPYDLHALEEALRLRDCCGGSVIALCMGPPSAAEQLKEAIGMGVDEAILLSDPSFAGADTLATAYTLARAVEKIGGVSLVLCGKQAIDGDTAQVGPEIAENLDWPHLTSVSKINDIDEDGITAERMTDEGYERLQLTLPALLTVTREINEPRLPALRGMIRAKKATIPIWGPADLQTDPAKIGLQGSPTQVWKIFTPDHHADGEILQGEAAELVEKLVESLLAKNIITP